MVTGAVKFAFDFSLEKPYSFSKDPGSKGFRVPDPDPNQRIKVFLTPKIVSTPSEIWSGMLILDPDLDFFYPSRIPDPQGSKRHRIPDPQHLGQVAVKIQTKQRQAGMLRT